MSRELDLLAKEFSKTPVTVMRTEVNLYQSNIQTATSALMKKVEKICKSQKTSTFNIVILIREM